MAYMLTIVTLYNVHGYKAGTAVGYILNEPIRNAFEQVEKAVAQLVRAPTWGTQVLKVLGSNPAAVYWLLYWATVPQVCSDLPATESALGAAITATFSPWTGIEI